MRRNLRIVVALALAMGAVTGSPVAAGPTGGALPPVLIDVIQIGGRHGVPDDAVMVAATITSVNPFENGWIKAFPCDQDEPDTANLNFVGDQVANNLVMARLAADGTLCIATRTLTDYVIDLAGYVPAGSDITPLPSPVRALDTRATGPSPVPDGHTVELQLGDRIGIPDTATLAIFNLTAVGGPRPGRITAHPCDRTPGTTSSVNFPAGRNIPNLVTSRLAPDNTVCFTTKNPVDIVVDVAAYATDGITTLPTPRRILDTRNQPGLLPADHVTPVDPRLPDDATAAIYNLASVDAPDRGYAIAHPCDTDRPTASNLNFDGPQAVAVGAITKLAANGSFCLANKTPTELIVDLIGYTTHDATYTPLTPKRIKDTRTGWQRQCDWVIVDEDPQAVGILNVATGERRVVSVTNALLDVSGPRITAGCDGVIVFVNTFGPTGGTHRVWFDGRRGHIERPEELGDYLITSVFDMGDVVLVGGEGGALYDAASGVEVWGGPRTPEMVDQFDLAPNGTALVRYTIWDDPDQPVTVLETWAVGHEERLGRIELATSVANISISPNGRYVAAGFQRSGDREHLAGAWTVFGDPVDGWIAPVGVQPVFAGNGSLLLCADFNGVYQWDLYAPLRVLVDWPTLSGHTSNTLCSKFRQ